MKEVLSKMILYCQDGTVDENFNMCDDDDILWCYGDDETDQVTRYINFITGRENEYRKLLRLMYDLYQSCGSNSFKLDEIDNTTGKFICSSEEHTDVTFYLALKFSGELSAFFDATDNKFSHFDIPMFCG